MDGPFTHLSWKPWISKRSHQSIVLLNSNKMNLSLPKVPISLRSLINKTINLHLLQGHRVKANGAFQANAIASERIFNVDKLVYDDRRKSLGVETGSGLVIAHDFLMRRKNPAEFRLCPQCPAPQSSTGQPCYKINCAKHNEK